MQYMRRHTVLLNSFKQKSGEFVWEWILRVWDNGERNMNLGQAEFIHISPLSRDCRFNMEACTVSKVGRPRRHAFANPIRNKMVWGHQHTGRALLSLTPLIVPYLRVGDTAAGLDELNAMV